MSNSKDMASLKLQFNMEYIRQEEARKQLEQLIGNLKHALEDRGGQFSYDTIGVADILGTMTSLNNRAIFSSAYRFGMEFTTGKLVKENGSS